jgi:hypothetical protein
MPDLGVPILEIYCYLPSTTNDIGDGNEVITVIVAIHE